MELAIHIKTPANLQKTKEYLTTRIITNQYTIDQLKNWRDLDLYFILDLDGFKDLPIPKSVLNYVYKKQIKKYHPETNNYPSEVLYVIQKAYKILGNDQDRMKYDCILFDDTIPQDRKYELQEFLDTFGSCFRKNSKFSNVQPIPDLGTLNSSAEEIKKFYTFWQNFSSWRVFDLKYTSDSLMNREERRELEMQNKTKIMEDKKREMLRIKKLTDIAMKRDPRLIKKVSFNPLLVQNGWEEEEIVILIKLLKEFKVGEKNRFENITRRFNDYNHKRRSLQEVFCKCNQIKNVGDK